MDDLDLQMMRMASQGLSCAQILVALGLEIRGESNPALVRAMAGLAYGCGTGGASCGALTGACCLMAFCAGTEEMPEGGPERLAVLLEALSDWFDERAGTPDGDFSCRAIVGEEGPAAARRKCGLLVADTFRKTMEILAANGFDPAT